MSEVDDNAIAQQDADEWDSALNKFDTEKGVQSENVEDKTQEADETAKAAADKKAADDAAAGRENETDEEREAREKKEAEEAEAAKNTETDEQAAARRERAQAAREARAIQRDSALETEAMQKDIVETMFKDNDGKLYDADGDEINGFEDVMLLRNPSTGKNFTEDEAAAWFLKATQHVQQERADAIEKAKEYAEVNVNIKDEADTIKEKYGDFLADPKNHTLRDEILQDYLDTLITDEASGVVIKAPVSMIRFYDRALKPYVEAQSTINSAEEARKAAEESAAAAKAEADKAKTRNDREDIFARGDSGRDTLTKEEQEWADAEKSYYGKK